MKNAEDEEFTIRQGDCFCVGYPGAFIQADNSNRQRRCGAWCSLLLGGNQARRARQPCGLGVGRKNVFGQFVGGRRCGKEDTEAVRHALCGMAVDYVWEGVCVEEEYVLEDHEIRKGEYMRGRCGIGARLRCVCR